jgi:hypothetical protein
MLGGAPAQSSVRVLDYLDDPAIAAYFAAREHEAYFRSLKSVDERRAFHDDLTAALVRLLEVADARAQQVLDEIIARSARSGDEPVGRPIDHVRRIEPEGVRLLGLDGGLDFGRLRHAYRKAALRYHPDRGGSNEEMAAVNRAYEQLHLLLVEQGEYDDDLAVSAWGFEARTALDYLWADTRLLFEVALDDWALDEALIWLDRLTSDAFVDSAFARADGQLIDLIEPLAKLAERLMAVEDRGGAERALGVARVALERAQARGLRYDGYVARAEEVVEGQRKARFVLNHVRQLENARRLGAIDDKRYQANLTRLDQRQASKEVTRKSQGELLTRVSFVTRLPTDTGLRPASESRSLVPQPDYYQVRVEDLSADQQAEYLKAFGSAPELGLVKKYAFVRLSGLVRSVVYYPAAVDADALSAEALVLARLEPRSAWVAERVAQVIGFFAKLEGERRRAYARELRELLEPERTGSGFVIIVMPGARELSGSFLESAEQRGREVTEGV